MKAHKDVHYREKENFWLDAAGREQFVGTIISLKRKEGPYGKYIMILIDLPDHRRVWMSLPSELGAVFDNQGMNDKDIIGYVKTVFEAALIPTDDDEFFIGKDPKWIPPNNRDWDLITY